MSIYSTHLVGIKVAKQAAWSRSKGEVYVGRAVLAGRTSQLRGLFWGVLPLTLPWYLSHANEIDISSYIFDVILKRGSARQLRAITICPPQIMAPSWLWRSRRRARAQAALFRALR